MVRKNTDSNLDRRGFLGRCAKTTFGMTAVNALGAPRAGAEAPSSPVAVRVCKRYDRELLYDRFGTMFQDLGGLTDLVSGKRVAMKINGTGTGFFQHSTHSKRAHTTHPNVVYAACLHLLEAGASKINLMESWPSIDDAKMVELMGFDKSEFEGLGDGSQVRFFNTRNNTLDEESTEEGLDAYAKITVAEGVGAGAPYLFDHFYVNKLWVPPKADVFVSMAKLKGHEACGVTLSMKNIFGCTPNAVYGSDALNQIPYEDAIGGRVDSCHYGLWNEPANTTLPGEIADAEVPAFPAERMPRLIADLVRALPIGLSIVEGITATQGAWGPTEQTSITTPGVLVAGFNAVCVDAVCVGIMGQDPQAAKGTGMFLSGENHLALAAAKEVGSNDLTAIPVLGNAIAEVRYDYSPHVNLAADNPLYEKRL